MPARRSTAAPIPARGEVAVDLLGSQVALIRAALADCPLELVCRTEGAGFIGRWNYPTILVMRADDWRQIAHRLTTTGLEGIHPEAVIDGDAASAFGGLAALQLAQRIAEALPHTATQPQEA